MAFGGGGRNVGAPGSQGGLPSGGVPQAGSQRTVPAQGQGAPAPRGNNQGGQTGGGGGQALTIAGVNWDVLDQQLVQYLLANQDDARFLVATPSSTYASVFMLATDQPAMALGGYQGWDRVLTTSELADQVRDGTVRFFFLSGGNSRGFAGGTGSQDATADLATWVQISCSAVPASTWQTSAGGGAATGTTQQLYDCAAVAQVQR